MASVMCAYNKINGVYACENDHIINNLLKGQLGFKGFVQSDWSATHSTVDSANHGLDMTMPGKKKCLLDDDLKRRRIHLFVYNKGIYGSIREILTLVKI